MFLKEYEFGFLKLMKFELGVYFRNQQKNVELADPGYLSMMIRYCECMKLNSHTSSEKC